MRRLRTHKLLGKIFGRFIFCHLRNLIVYNYELLDESATDEKESLAIDNEEDLSIVFFIDDEAEED